MSADDKSASDITQALVDIYEKVLKKFNREDRKRILAAAMP